MIFCGNSPTHRLEAKREGGSGDSNGESVDNFRFFNLKVYPFADAEGAVAEVEAEGVIKATGRTYRQDYVVFLRVAGGKIVFLREFFDPVRAAKAMDLAIVGLNLEDFPILPKACLTDLAKAVAAIKSASHKRPSMSS